MPIKLNKHVPPPLPAPPTMFSLDGLYADDIEILRKVVYEGILTVSKSNGFGSLIERDRADRILRVLRGGTDEYEEV